MGINERSNSRSGPTIEDKRVKIQSRAYRKNKQERNRKLIDELTCSNRQIFSLIEAMEKQENDLAAGKTKCILALAENFEKLQELGEYKEPIYTIERILYTLARENGLSITQTWIRKILPDKYKQPMLHLSLYNALELNELVASSLLPLDYHASPTSSPTIATTTHEQEQEQNEAMGKGMSIHPFNIRKMDNRR